MGRTDISTASDSDNTPTRRGHGPATPTSAALVCGLLVTFLVTGAAAYQSYQQGVMEFESAAERTFDALDDTVARDLERAHNLALMVRAGARIDVDDPPATQEPASDSGLEFLAWLEPVSDSDQLRVTPLLSASGGQAVASRLLETENDGTRASRRALERALETGGLTGTRDAVLFQANGKATPGFMAFLPVSGGDGVDGVVALGLRLDRLASIARDGRELTMHIFEGTRERLLLYGPGENAGVAEHTDASALRKQLHVQREFAVASQRWTVFLTPAEAPTWFGSAVVWPFLGGLVLTGMAGWLVGRERSRTGALAGDLGQTRQQLQHLQRDYAATRETLERETVARTTTEHCLDLLENQTRDAVLRLSASRTIVSASPAVEQVLGVSPRELVGRSRDSVLLQETESTGDADESESGDEDGEQTFLTADSDGTTNRQLVGRLLRLPSGMSNAEAELLVLQRPEPTGPARRPVAGDPDPFRQAFDHASTGMGLFHPDTGHCLYVNQALCDVLGYAQDELLNMTYHDLTHPADQHATREQLDAIRNAAGDGFRVEKRYLHKTGRVVWVEVTGSVLRDSDGQELYVASQIRDITDQKQTEQALQQINHRHDLILNAAAEAIFGLDTRGRVVFANAAACHLLSREPATIEGQPLAALLRHSDDPVADEWPVHKCLDRQELMQADGAIFRRGDGTPFPADYTVSPMVDDGRVTGAVVVMADASERQEGEARFRSAFEDVAVGMALIGLDGHFLRANGALCSLVGYDAGELLAMRSTDLLHPDDREANYRTNRLLLDGNRPTGPVEQRLCHRDGGIVWALTSTSLVRDPGGEPRYLLKQAQDITPRKVAEAALRTSEARFRGIFEQAAVGMALLEGEEATVQRINEALRTFLHCDVEALADRPFAELIHPDDRHDVETALASPAGGRGHAVEVRVARCQGHSSARRLRLARIDDDGAGGRPLHLVQVEP